MACYHFPLIENDVDGRPADLIEVLSRYLHEWTEKNYKKNLSQDTRCFGQNRGASK
jgi:hypothetical protein